MAMARISVTTLGVSDVQRSWDFYRALGWVGSSPDGEVVFFPSGGSVFALWSREKLAADSGVERDDGAQWAGVTLAMNVESPSEVDRMLVVAERAGALVLRAGAATFWGGYSGCFADPDGHRWEVAHNPLWEQDADGNITLPI